jgi:uncharacterized protein
MVKQEYKDKILKLIEEFLPEAKVYLYGSRAIDKETWASDIDVAIDNKKIVARKIFGEMLEKVEDLNVPLKIDLIDIYDIPSDFLDRIKKEWVVWKD